MVSCEGTKSVRERGLTILLWRCSYCFCVVLATEEARGAAFIAPISLRSRRQIVHGMRALAPRRLHRFGENPIFISGPFYHVEDATNEDRNRHTRRELAPCAVASVLSAAEAVKPVSADLSISRRIFSTMLSLMVGYIWAMLRKTLGWMSPSPLEVQLVLRLTFSAVVGILIGLERRTSHRPAGVRTMLVKPSRIVPNGLALRRLVRTPKAFAVDPRKATYVMWLSRVGFLSLHLAVLKRVETVNCRTEN